MKRVLLPLLLVLFLAGLAEAVTIGNTNVFATTRSGSVEWKTSSTLEVNALYVNATMVTLGDAQLDFMPSTGTLTATITTWTNDRRDFTVTNPSTSTFTFNMSNAGFFWQLYTVNGLQSTCVDTLSPCPWTFASGTNWNFTLRLAQPLGGGDSGSTPEVPDAGTGAPIASNPPASAPREFPSPISVFPRFSAVQWLTFGVGLVLLTNSSRRTRHYLPAFLRVPGDSIILLLAGAVTTVLVYLTTAATT